MYCGLWSLWAKGREAGLEPWSVAGTAARQAWVADLAERGLFGDGNASRKD